MGNIYMNKSTLMLNSNNISHVYNQPSSSKESKTEGSSISTEINEEQRAIEDEELSPTPLVTLSPRNIPSQTQVFKRTYEGNIVPGDDLGCLYQYMYQLVS